MGRRVRTSVRAAPPGDARIHRCVPLGRLGSRLHPVPTHGMPEKWDKMSVERVFSSVEPEIGWRLEFVRGSAGRELVDQSQHAQLLVLGAREHTGIERLVVGSTSHYCFSHAECPVVAVPAGRADNDEAPSVRARGRVERLRWLADR